MNDLERDLRQVFDEDARHVPTPTSAPDRLGRSVRRRQAVFGGLVGLSALAIVAGIVAGASMLIPTQDTRQPIGQGQTTTGSLNGISITYPEAWHLIDPDTAGLNGSPMMGESPLPRIVLALAPTEAPETFGCPGRAGGDAAPLLMTVQEEPPTTRRPDEAVAGRARADVGRCVRIGLLPGVGLPARRMDRVGTGVRGSGRDLAGRQRRGA